MNHLIKITIASFSPLILVKKNRKYFYVDCYSEIVIGDLRVFLEDCNDFFCSGREQSQFPDQEDRVRNF